MSDKNILSLIRENKKIRNLITALLITIVVLLIPASVMGLTVLQHRALTIFFLAVSFWILEPVPIFVTSMLIVFCVLFGISNGGLNFLRGSGENFGELMNYKHVYEYFAEPIIFLFLGGFFLANASSKYKLDLNLARIIIKPFGNRPEIVMLGMMLITAIFSMFMSNTATTAMMMATAIPILNKFAQDDKGKIAFALSIPFAANVGGIGTPIGTPPNAIALNQLSESNSISFGSWMSFSVPYVFILLLITWFVLTKFYPFKEKEIIIKMDSEFDKSFQAKVLYVIFPLTIFLWVLGKKLFGLNSYTVAFIPIITFLLTGVINKSEIGKLDFSVLWLMSGAFVLGGAIENTGLGLKIINSINFNVLNPLVIIIIAGIIACLFGTFMSHTAATSLLMPILIVLARQQESLKAIGGEKMIVIVIAYAASIAMALPTSTPPNAIAHSTGYIQTKHMIVPGLTISAIGLILTFILINLLRLTGLISSV